MAGRKQTAKMEQAEREPKTLRDFFSEFSERAAVSTGSPWAFAIAIISLILWAITGPWFHYSNTWQLVVNTATTIVTFVMVFIIQSAENRDTQALQIKLDELLMALNREEMIDIEDLTATELKRLQSRMEERYGKLIPKDALE